MHKNSRKFAALGQETKYGLPSAPSRFQNSPLEPGMRSIASTYYCRPAGLCSRSTDPVERLRFTRFQRYVILNRSKASTAATLNF
jgi:hypothetical protein